MAAALNKMMVKQMQLRKILLSPNDRSSNENRLPPTIPYGITAIKHTRNSSPVLLPVVELDSLIKGIVINIANSTGVLPIVAQKVARAAVHAMPAFSKTRQYNSQPIPNTRLVISQIFRAMPMAVYFFFIFQKCFEFQSIDTKKNYLDALIIFSRAAKCSLKAFSPTLVDV